MKPYPISQSRSKQIAQVCLMPKESLERLGKAVGETDQVFISVEDFVVFLRNTIDDPDLKSLSSFLIGMRRAADHNSLNAEQMLDAIGEGLVEFGWGKEQIASWNERRQLLESLIDSELIKIVAKASNLYYLGNKHIHELKVVTTSIPIFSDERNSILSYIVKNELHLIISDPFEKEQNIQVPIGQDEMERLLSEIERALQKTKLLLTETKKHAVVPPRLYTSLD